MIASHARCHRRLVPIDPVEPHCLVELFADADYVCSLDSGSSEGPHARYHYLCGEPIYVLRSKGRAVWGGPPGGLELLDATPFEALERLRHVALVPVTVVTVPEAPPFLGGLVGYLGYELLHELETVPDTGRDDFAMPDMVMGFYDAVIAHDALLERTWLVVNGYGDTQADAEAACDARVADLSARIARITPTRIDGHALRARRDAIRARHGRLSPERMETLGVRPVCTREEYLSVVSRSLAHIVDGDIFEVCTTQRFDAECAVPGVLMYRISREVSPAPFGAYLRMPEGEVICSSPERFLSVDWQGWIETRPIKGTRPRGATPQQDAAYRRDLETNPKDRAELVMITDLSRNDLGRVCEFNTVEVLEEAEVEAHPFTFQRVSTVAGLIREDLTPVDLLRAAFPGGSMTGAPKVEAMKIIDALEPVKRGVFSGCIGYLGDATDLNIVIRTIIKKGDAITFHVGGAIVADSDPVEEYQETLDKAYGMVVALEVCRSMQEGS